MNSDASRQRDRHHERSGPRERDLADDAGSAARRQLPSRQVAERHGLQLQRDTVDRLDAHADGADARRGVHGDALEPNAAGRALLRVLRRRDRVSHRIRVSRSLSPAFCNGATGKISGGNYYWYFYDANRTTATAKLSHHADQFLGAQQDFHFGVQYNQAGVSGVYGYNDFIYTYLSDGKLYGYGNVRQPFSYAAQIRNIGAFVDDSIRLGNRVTLNLGVRVDHSNAFAPAQQELDDNAQPTGKTFPRADFFTWNSVSPRLGLNWKLTGDGKNDRQGPLGPLPSANHDRRVRQHHRSQHQAVLSGELQLRDRPGRGSVPDEQQRESERGGRLQQSPDRSVHHRVRAGADREDGPAGELRAQMGTRFRRLA